MFRNYLVTAFRSLRRNKVTSFINLLGLTIGIACCIFIFIYVHHELSFDRFHKKADNIFRFYTIDEALGVSSNNVAITEPAMPVQAKNEIPEILNTTRVFNQGRVPIVVGNKTIYTEDAKSVESSFFEIFDFGINDSLTRSQFAQPRKVILTKSMALKIFDDLNPVGEVVKINDNDWEVVSLIDDVPVNSHLNLDLIMSIYPTPADSNIVQYLESWQGLGMIGYAVLKNASDEKIVEEKMLALTQANEVPKFWIPQLQPLTDIHLKSSGILFDAYNKNKGDITYIYSLSAVALIILVIAAFNFMNLTTAQASTRAKEVGVRKVLGAFRIHLIKQHLGESLLVCAISTVLAIILVIILGPGINLGVNGSLATHIFSHPDIFLWIAATAVIIGLLAGMYPAFILSSYATSNILRGKFQGSKGGIFLRKMLVIVQFVASIAMIIGTIFVFRQMQYIKNMNLGFDKDQILTIQMNEPTLREKMIPFRNELIDYERIVGAGVSSNMPGRTFGRTGARPEGTPEEDDPWIVSALSFDENFLDVLGMEIVAGRNYSPEVATDQQEAIIVNEALVRQVGWDIGIGKKLYFGSGENRVERTIVGIVKDFHFASMRHNIEPLIMFYSPGANSNLSIKIEGDISQTMASIKDLWASYFPDNPFEYQFFDEEFNAIYESDEKFSLLISNFTWLSIFIACLGLFGLSTHIAEQRKKEIGVRKVMGSSISAIVILLSGEFALLIVVANLLAWPLSYFAVNNWVAEFQYKIDLLAPGNLLIYLFAGIIALIIGLLTVSYQSISAALINPVNSLRNE